MQEYLARQDRFKDIERDILTNPDNIFTPKPGPNDTPEMKGLKEAVAAKKIDIDKYADRFGDNFSNAKRKMRDESVSLLLLKRICDCLDMKAELIISDVSPDVPNPMGEPIHIQITGDTNIDNDSEKEGS